MKRWIRRLTGRERNQGSELDLPRYDQDHLRTAHNHDFMTEPRFVKAYERGIEAAGSDFQWHWRVHVGLWAASTASRLPGDFVECGVGHGFLSSAILDYLDWNESQPQRHFYLLDTFTGLDERCLTQEEVEQKGSAAAQNANGIKSGVYAEDAKSVHRNFEQWERIRIIEGMVPETLEQVESEQIAFLHLDLNCAQPEVAALEHFWERIVAGGVILLDDYAYVGYHLQKEAMDKAIHALGHEVLSLPTGQGMIIKT